MTDERQQIIARAERLQRQGKVGDSIKLRMFANLEHDKMVLGPVATHGPEDVRE